MNGVHDLDRLRTLLGGDDVRWLRAALRRRFERGHATNGTVGKASPTDAEREAIDRLLGRRPTAGAALRIDIAGLEARLREARVCETLRGALEALDGPLRDLATERGAVERAWSRIHARLDEACATRPWLAPWWESVRTDGLLRRLSHGDPDRASDLADCFLDLASRLPASGLALPELAAQITGDAHALDRGAPLGTLATRAVALRAGIVECRRTDPWREAWARAGVICDEVSAPVLTLNLGATRLARAGLTDRVLALHREAGELCSLTLRQLVGHPPDLSHLAGGDVFVCENPTIAVAAARRLGATAAPLVCTAGQLRASTRFLLQRIADAGARLRVRADFDAAGLRIAGALLDHPNATPWRMSTTEYLAASGPRLRAGAVPLTPWEPGLREAMSARRVGVHEESLVGALLDDLVAEPAARR